MKIQDKTYDVYFRRNSKERYWKLEMSVSLYGFKNLLDQILEKTQEEVIEIKLIKKLED